MSQSTAAHKSRRYASAQLSEAERLNQPRLVFSPFRSLDTSKMRICVNRINRCELTLIESYPINLPSYGDILDLNRVALQEKMVEAFYQLDSLRNSFGQEGLVVFDADVDADILADVLRPTATMNLADAVTHVSESALPADVKRDVILGFTTATQWAHNILNDTKREIQSARAGKPGKDYLDERDLNACVLLGIPEASIMSLEGTAANQTLERLATQIASAVTSQARPTEPVLPPEIALLIKEQGAQIAKLNEKLAAMEKGGKK